MNFLNDVVHQIFGVDTRENLSFKSIGGGCIHQAGCFTFDGSQYFIKWNQQAAQMFETEAKGLALLRNARAVTVPEVVGCGSLQNLDYLCLEYYEKGEPSNNFWETFGRSVACLHRNNAAQFGLDHDNYIGSLSQSNQWQSEWVYFFVNQRLIPQVSMAHHRGLLNTQHLSQFEKLYAQLPALIPVEQPALLHGDLWSGNFLVGQQGQAVIFDPAVYYGHREAEIAFTKMFGGYDRAFYEAYQEAFPLQPEHEKRVELFNLYPLLVHVNLFGASYLSGIEATLRRFA